MRAERGLTLIECVVALALLALILTMSFTVLDRHRKFLARMDQRLAATHAAEVELETLLAQPFTDLSPREASPSTTRPAELIRLEDGKMTHAIFDTDAPSLRRVRVEVHWKQDGGRGAVAEALVYGGARGHW